MVPRFLFIALDSVGDLPDAGSFGGSASRAS